jgi:hypothetical protein
MTRSNLARAYLWLDKPKSRQSEYAGYHSRFALNRHCADLVLHSPAMPLQYLSLQCPNRWEIPHCRYPELLRSILTNRLTRTSYRESEIGLSENRERFGELAASL